MTTPNDWSARRSARVGAVALSADVSTGDGTQKAPGTMASSKTPPPPLRRAAERRARRVSRTRLNDLHTQLSPRDHAILATLSSFRFLTTSQLQALHFTQHATQLAAARICRRVLQRLAELRVIEPIERRIGGLRAGSSAYVWRVGPVGDRLLRATGDRPRARRKEPSLRHLDHSLAVANCYVTLVVASRTSLLELLSVQPEPVCWRSYHGPGGSWETLKPDLYVVTATGDYEDHWFIEVDRATESLPTLLGKCAQYERYRRTGQAQVGGGVFPRVLWVMPDERRTTQLERGLQAARSLDAGLFRTATPAGFLATVTEGAS